MEKVKDTFGLSRVVEPGASVPVTAWKLDNRREIRPEECRVALKLIHLEKDCFQQLCNECGDDETKIITRILDLVGRRGKLHNPFTNTAGNFSGTIEEMGSKYSKHTKFHIGDEICCVTTMTALPVHIDKIHKIDYNFGILTVSGYGIIFIDSPLTAIPPGIPLEYTMVAFDESANFYTIFNASKARKRFLIIGKDLLSSLIYVAAIKKATNSDCHITVILNEDGIGTLTPEQATEELTHWVDSSYILDVTQPIRSSEQVLNGENGPYDLTVNCEDLLGSEVLSVILTRRRGQLYFTSLKNSYTQSNLFAESMNKEMETHMLCQYFAGVEEFTIGLLSSISKDLDRLKKLYQAGDAGRRTRKKAGPSFVDETGKAGGFVFSSPSTGALVEEVLNIAEYDCNVILQGETGVGKEKVMELIHKNSARKNKPCVKINCATVHENLAESEFFGYEPGSFTGAQASGKRGYFELANGGILFLDEVGALSLNLQSKLLRVLQENQFYRVGGMSPININVRVICASNVPLRQLVEQGKFREDLYYRLNICTINVPPLRDRKEDVIALAQAFLENYCSRYGTDKEFEKAALAKLTEYDWPGNVRELENLIHRTVISVRGHIITGDDVEGVLNENIYEDLVINLKRSMRTSASLDFNRIIEQQEIQLIEYALKKFGSTRKAAEFLHMTQPQLMRKKQKYNI